MYERRGRPKAMDDPSLYYLRDDSMTADSNVRSSKGGRKPREKGVGGASISAL